jgi:hypothetical protein
MGVYHKDSEKLECPNCNKMTQIIYWEEMMKDKKCPSCYWFLDKAEMCDSKDMGYCMSNGFNVQIDHSCSRYRVKTTHKTIIDFIVKLLLKVR